MKDFKDNVESLVDLVDCAQDWTVEELDSIQRHDGALHEMLLGWMSQAANIKKYISKRMDRVH